jgi:phage terminase large subunit-like protein
VLQPWQIWLTCAIFGWLRLDGKRRFRKIFLLVPRKNGKSILAAAWGLYMLCADDEFGAEVFSGATTEKQAWEVFRPARLMAERTPALQEAFGLTVHAKSLSILSNGSRFEPLIGKPGDGASPSCAIHDEYHEHDTDEQVDAMETGMGAREQPLQIIVTTAGDNLSGPCFQLQIDAQKVLDGVLENDELFTVVYSADTDDDWTSEEALIKANPNYNISVDAEFLRARQKEAVQTARKQGIFKTKHLNWWVSARDAYFNIEQWRALGDPDLTIEDFEGRDCWLALDLASKIDIAALEILFRHKDGFARFGKYYLPEKTIEEPENEHYRGWRNQGYITQTDGSIIDYEYIKDDILEIMRRFTVLNVAYDPHQATMLVTSLMKENVPLVEFRPLVLNFSEPMKYLEGLIKAGKIKHDGDPVMTWMMSNVTAKVDAKDNVYPRKERAENKIDGPICLIMDLGLAMKEDAPEDLDAFLSAPLVL